MQLEVYHVQMKMGAQLHKPLTQMVCSKVNMVRIAILRTRQEDF